jgi:hypothetical protein
MQHPSQKYIDDGADALIMLFAGLMVLMLLAILYDVDREYDDDI